LHPKRIAFQISSPNHHSQASIATTAGTMAMPSTIGKRKSQAGGMRSDASAAGSVHAVMKAPGSNHHRLGRTSGYPPTRSHQPTSEAHWIAKIRTSALRVLPYFFSQPHPKQTAVRTVHANQQAISEACWLPRLQCLRVRQDDQLCPLRHTGGSWIPSIPLLSLRAAARQRPLHFRFE
jgi:hypothetical protein